jgi:hypothetical protein
LQDVLVRTFLIEKRVEEESSIVLPMARESNRQPHWDVANDRWDFTSFDASCWLLDG